MRSPNLKSSLSIGFNDRTYNNGEYFFVENTPVVPLEGESIRFHWEQYIKDPKQVESLELFEENGLFVVHVALREFTQDEVITHLVLHEESDYRHNYGSKM